MDSQRENPNFVRAAEALHTLAHEIEVCTNITSSQQDPMLNRVIYDIGSLTNTVETLSLHVLKAYLYVLRTCLDSLRAKKLLERANRLRYSQ